jgi:DNA primase
LARLVSQHPLGEAGRAYLAARRLLDPASGRPSGGLVFGEATADLPKYAGRLLVPSFSARGSVVHVTFRCMEDHDCRKNSHSKYLHWPGLEARLYGLGSLRTAGDTIHLCEGQLDAASLIAAGLPAVGIPGAQGWKAHHHRLFQGFDRVLFWADQDDKGAGMMLFENVRRSLPNVELVHVPAGHDVNSLLVAGGRDALMALLDAGDGAESYDGSNDEKGEYIDDTHYDDMGNVIPF